jgi:hypothetical protein
MQDERRKYERRFLMYFARVFNRRTGAVFGFILDLTPEGAMVFSQAPVKPKMKFLLRMELPENLADKAFIDFEAQSVWCRREADSENWDVGFSLNLVDEADLHIIEQIIAEYGFRED